MNKFLLFLAGCMMFLSCKNVPPPVMVTNGKYTLIDSAGKPNKFAVDDDTSRFAWYPVYYIGKTQLTYYIPYQPLTARTHQKVDSNMAVGHLSAQHINIFVDTSLHVANENIFVHTVYEEGAPASKPPKKFIDSINYYKAYPVFFTNMCDSILWLGNSNYVNFVVREAKDEKGNWQRIETLGDGPACGFMARNLFLPAHQVLIAKLILNSGSFKTECRLRIRAGQNYIYSNAFVDHIDKSVFRPFKRVY